MQAYTTTIPPDSENAKTVSIYLNYSQNDCSFDNLFISLLGLIMKIPRINPQHLSTFRALFDAFQAIFTLIHGFARGIILFELIKIYLPAPIKQILIRAGNF